MLLLAEMVFSSTTSLQIQIDRRYPKIHDDRQFRNLFARTPNLPKGKNPDQSSGEKRVDRLRDRRCAARQNPTASTTRLNPSSLVEPSGAD